MTVKDCVIFDLDGTLSDLGYRLHHVRGDAAPDWPAFFDACVDDLPQAHTIRLSQVIAFHNAQVHDHRRITIFICTGRPDSHRAVTGAWLETYGVGYDVLMMRETGDHRSDVALKAEMLAGIRGQGYEPAFVVDDRPSVVAMWRAAGVPCFAMDDANWRVPQHSRFGTVEYPLAGRTLLTLMVGPSHAGKTAWLTPAPWHPETRCIVDASRIMPRDLGIYPSHVITFDRVREDVLDDPADMTQNRRVFAAVHAVVAARLAHGLPTVIDATHLRRKQRLEAVSLAPPGTRVRYVVVDRPLAEKLRNLKPDFPEAVVRKHDHDFASQLTEILGGDDRENVDVVDLLTR